MSKYQKATDHLKHIDSWGRAEADRKGELEITEVVFERGTNGLVRIARGVVMMECPIRIGNRYEMRPTMVNVTWSFQGICRDWRHHRLSQFDLNIKETAEERKQSMTEWLLASKNDLRP